MSTSKNNKTNNKVANVNDNAIAFENRASRADQMFKTLYDNLMQWYKISSWESKMKFLNNLLDDHWTPSFLYLLKMAFGNAYTSDAVYTENIPILLFDVRPNDNNRFLDVETLKTMMCKYRQWFKQLSDVKQLDVFIELTKLGGMPAIAVVMKRINHWITSNEENSLSLQSLIMKDNVGSVELKKTGHVQDDTIVVDGLKYERKFPLSVLGKNKVKTTDALYRNYVLRNREWDTKLDAFGQKHCKPDETSRSDDDDDDLNDDMMPVWTAMEFCDDLLKDTAKRKKDVSRGSSNMESSTEYMPSHLKRQHEMLTEYKVARHYIDDVINTSTREKELKSACDTSRSDNANKVDTTVSAIKCNTKGPFIKTTKKQKNVLNDRLANTENIVIRCSESHINITTKLNKRCYDVRLANPFNDRRTKQSECLCVLENVRASFV